MEPIAADLERAARSGREHTERDAALTARATTTSGLESQMSLTAEHELFTEALLAAAHAHFEEIKTVTR
ncbi:MAG: hypothetical protein ACREM8_05145 [Vulcanimicrobiaceae bacterium]